MQKGFHIKMNNYKNPQLKLLIQQLKKQAIEQKVLLWKRIASDLEGPARNQRVVNVYKIEQYAKPNETVLVPGKVLGTGELNKKVTVAAYSFSEEAKKKISGKGVAMSISELVEKNPKGKGVRILG